MGSEETIERSISTIFSGVDELMEAGHFQLIDILLRRLDSDEFDTAVMLVVLTATLTASEKLTQRAAVAERVQRRLTNCPATSRTENED